MWRFGVSRVTHGAGGFWGLGDWRAVLMTAVVLALPVAQSPLLLVYGRATWIDRPHYRFLPLLLLAVIGLILREARQAGPLRCSKLWPVWLSVFCGVIVGIAATLFSETTLAAAAVGLVGLGLLAATRNSNHKSLLPIGILVLLGVVPPMQLDWKLIRTLQSCSVQLASVLLDLIGILHVAQGATFELLGNRRYFVEEACSGIQSFFTLVFLALCLAAIRRDHLPRIVFLVSCCVPLSLVSNALRIVTIVVADVAMGWDLSSGMAHELLGYFMLTTAVLFLLYFDRLQQTLWDSFHTVHSSHIPQSSVESELAASLPARTRLSSLLWIGPSLALLLLSLLMLGQQWHDVQTLLADPSLRIRFFDDLRIASVESDDLPLRIGKWRCIEFQTEVRSRGSELGKQSNVWSLVADDRRALVSLDQPFPGWHELSICYRNQGWKLVSRQVITPDHGERWPYVKLQLTNDFGEQTEVYFALFDSKGKGLEPVAVWEGWPKFWSRVQNRLTFRVRSKLSQAEAFQVQTLGGDEALFLESRERLRRKVVGQFL